MRFSVTPLGTTATAVNARSAISLVKHVPDHGGISVLHVRVGGS